MRHPPWFKLITTVLRSATTSGEALQILSCDRCHCLVASSEISAHEQYHQGDARARLVTPG